MLYATHSWNPEDEVVNPHILGGWDPKGLTSDRAWNPDPFGSKNLYSFQYTWLLLHKLITTGRGVFFFFKDLIQRKLLSKWHRAQWHDESTVLIFQWWQMSIQKDTQWSWHGAGARTQVAGSRLKLSVLLHPWEWSSIGRQGDATAKIYLRAQNWFHKPKPSANQIEDGVSKRWSPSVTPVSTCHQQWARMDAPQVPPHRPEPSLRAPLAMLGWEGRPSSPALGSLKQSSWARRRGQVTDATMFVSAKHNRCILWCRTIENLNIFLAEQQKQNVLFLFCFGFASSRTGTLAHILDLCPSFLPGQYMMNKSHIAPGWWESRGKEVRCDVGCACVCVRAPWHVLERRAPQGDED